MWSKNELKAISDARVKSLVEGGTLDNAKPLYFHPITLGNTSDSANTYSLSWTMIIIDNNSEPYNTWQKVKEKMLAVANAIGDTARFLVNGGLSNNDKSVVVICNNIDARTDSTLRLYGLDTGRERYSLDITSISIAECYDGVNKIN